MHFFLKLCRLGDSNGIGGDNKPNTTSLPNSSSMGLSPKSEQGVPLLLGDLTGGSNKEKIIPKENSKWVLPICSVIFVFTWSVLLISCEASCADLGLLYNTYILLITVFC